LHLHPLDVRAILETTRLDVLLDLEDRLAGVLDERRRPCPPRQGLEAKRAGSRVEIEHDSVLEVSER
jgi:hypothetical protein